MRDFDDEEKRMLYVERTMGCYHYDGRTYEQNLEALRIPPRLLRQEGHSSEHLLLGKEQTEFFSITRIGVSGELPARDSGTFSIAIVIDGAGRLRFDGGAVNINKGDELFLPASIQGLVWTSDTSLSAVLSYPPGVL
jgi:mannose-6-phosphate isomerase